MTTEVVTRTPVQELAAQIRGDEFKSQVAMVLPEGTSPDRFVRVMNTWLAENPPDLDKYDKSSIFTAALKCAADGLVPDQREAAFVPFKGKITYVPMKGGFIRIAGEHGWAIRAAVVYANDTFEQEQGLEQKLVHVPTRPGADRGPMVAAYAVATHRDGRKDFLVMYEDEINKVRAGSAYADKGPWVEWTDRMWEKTVVRRLFKRLPLENDPRVLRVLEASVEGEASVDRLYGEATHDFSPSRASLPQGEPTGASSPEHEGSAPPAPDDVFADEPAAAEGDDADAVAAGEIKITGGAYAGRSIADVSGDKRWIKWACKTETFSGCLAARAYAKHYLPDVYQEAMGELETED